MSRVRIEMTGPYTGKVLVDGVEQDKLVEVRVDASIPGGRPWRVTLTKTIFPTELEIEGEVDVTTLSSGGIREFRWCGKADG